MCGRGNSAGAGHQSPLCVPLSPQGSENIHSPNICFPISMWVAFLPALQFKSLPPFSFSQVAYKPQLPNLSVGLIFLWCPCTYVIKFDFLLLFCLMSILFLDQPEEPRKGRGDIFPSPTQPFFTSYRWTVLYGSLNRMFLKSQLSSSRVGLSF